MKKRKRNEKKGKGKVGKKTLLRRRGKYRNTNNGSLTTEGQVGGLSADWTASVVQCVRREIPLSYRISNLKPVNMWNPDEDLVLCYEFKDWLARRQCTMTV